MRRRYDGLPVRPTTGQPDYDVDDLEFLRAIQAYKKATGRLWPSYCELLAVAKSCGWRKVEPAGPLPGVKEEGESDG